MKNATDEIIHELSKRGFRITKARTSVLKKLEAASQPLSIQALCAAVDGTDEVSVYRTVRMLRDEGFLEEIVLQGGQTRYALSDGHHHHAVCTQCGFMEHVSCREEELKKELPDGFAELRAHEVTLYGVCKKCV